MYIVKSGIVEVRKKDPITGIDFLVAQLSEGAAVGEMSLLTGKPRTATVTTVVPTTLFTLTRADFRNLLRNIPKFPLALPGFLPKDSKMLPSRSVSSTSTFSRASLTRG
jgi:CRP-like cAMP-binding protein